MKATIAHRPTDAQSLELGFAACSLCEWYGSFADEKSARSAYETHQALHKARGGASD